MVIQDLIGGEIVDSPADYMVEIDADLWTKGLTLTLTSNGWFIADEFGETVFSSGEIQ
jgi:hypothetical protein